ncbi:MarR family winged helix-turn-helix transcriptional regulator [Pontibacter indicus]|uniref:DNA-binding transcriptional regulator, MarR family n=1 Tax=Pontibacter indicus TaxID=1317125 RepID=A0A1R3XPA0_9BACT|nr:MarR family transcriptional regulator [Pontibacter indicus]SIT93756.1 DNA-binding transcriptional regulator, MarR family [Pontibacter indicus]
MKLEDELKMPKFRSPFQKASLNLMFTGEWMMARVDGLLKPYDISSQQFNVLRILRGQHGKPLNLFTIQERMLNRMSNATRLVEKLRLKGLVTRELCEQNRRKVEIAITKKGIELLDSLDPLMKQLEEDTFKSLTEAEAQHLSDILDQVRD